MANRTKNKKKYSYQRIADLKVGTSNVFGVVKFCKLPSKSRGKDLVQVLSITDDSLDEGEKLGINLFYRSTDRFPKISVGDVIRFHRLKIDPFHGALKGSGGGPGFAWLFIHDDIHNPSVSTNTFTYTDQCKERVKQLQQWARGQKWLKDSTSASSTLSGLQPAQYCDLVCQVLAVSPADGHQEYIVLRIWDGTLSPYKYVTIDKPLEMDSTLEQAAFDRMVDVWVFDDHVASCSHIQRGQFIKLNNLHASIRKENPDGVDSSPELFPCPNQILELTIHGGTSYGRGVVLLDKQSPLVAPVRERMNRCLSGQASGPASRRLITSTSSTTTTTTTSAMSPATADDGGPPAHNPGRRTSPAEGPKGQTPKPGCSHWDQTRTHCQQSPKRPTLRKEWEKLDEAEKLNEKDHDQRRLNEQHNEGGGGDAGEQLQSPTHKRRKFDEKLCEKSCDLGKKTNQINDRCRSLIKQISDNLVVTSTTCASKGGQQEPVECSDRGNDENSPIIISSGSLEQQEQATNHSGGGGGRSGYGGVDSGGGYSGGDGGGGGGCGGGDSGDGDGSSGCGHRGGVGSGSGCHGGEEGMVGSNGSSYPDNELRFLLSSSGSRSGSGRSVEGRQASVLNNTEMCMLQTASVVCGHQHMGCCSLKDVLRGPVPGKFRVLAQLVDFHPNTTDPWEFVRHLCPQCNYLMVPNREAAGTAKSSSVKPTGQQSSVMSVTSSITSKLTSLLKGRLSNWNTERPQDQDQNLDPDTPDLCPQCKSDGVATPMELTFMLRMVLQDSSGHCLLANLWREQAVTFFRGIHPEMVVSQEGSLEDVVTTLRSLCVNDDDDNIDDDDHENSPTSSPPPRLDLCLFSYLTSSSGGGGGGGGGGEVNFHIFDTVLV